MTEYFNYRNRIIKDYLILSTICISLFFLLDKYQIAYGFILGAFISGINFYLISLTNLKLATLQTKSDINFFIIKWLSLRYLLYILAIIISIKYSIFSLSGTLIGLFIIPVTLLFSRLILREC